jgi:hypothetical protein
MSSDPIYLSHTQRNRVNDMTYTAANFLASSKFAEIAMNDAVALLAKKNGQTIEATRKALENGAEVLSAQVAKLVIAAARHCAEEANAGRM